MSCERVERVVIEGDYKDYSFPVFEKLPDGRTRISTSSRGYTSLESTGIEEDEELWGRAAEGIGAEMELNFVSWQRGEGIAAPVRAFLSITTEDENLQPFWNEVEKLKRARKKREGKWVYPDDSVQ